MKDYTEFVDTELSDFYDPAYEEELDKFKSKRKAAMRDREVVLRKRGLSDAQVIYDLIISENSNIKHEFIELQKKALEDKEGVSTLCIVENHMCMDGGDLKSFLASFCEGYSELITEGKTPVKMIRQGSRSFEQVYTDLNPAEKRAAKKLYSNVSNKDKHGFAFTKDSDADKSFIVKRTIDAERFNAIRLAGKSIDATVNDVLVGAFLHSLYDVTDFDKSEEIVVSCAIDLRRYMSNLSDVGYTNHLP